MERYRDLNYKQAKRGVIIQRVFLFEDKQDCNAMMEVMQEQADKGIKVWYCYQKDISHIANSPDFSVMTDLGFAITVEKREKLHGVSLSRSRTAINRLDSQFSQITERATEVTSNAK
ncbi:MAG: hypothetical protein N838_29090 [Thiohalocapsa sp. PB-PSB1]|jgi:L-lysine 2,3-aminomutase|nr:MAG: hypothetical protein N838_29090 [Thiohalocapsa sp. PB-PSB1]